MSNIYCTGSEKSLLECNHQLCSITSCTHHSEAGVVCESKIVLDLLLIIFYLVPCINGTVRLSDNTVLKGRVEYCLNNTWTTICIHHWTAQEATVVCSQLGYSPYGIELSTAYNQPVYM